MYIQNINSAVATFIFDMTDMVKSRLYVVNFKRIKRIKNKEIGEQKQHGKANGYRQIDANRLKASIALRYTIFSVYMRCVLTNVMTNILFKDTKVNLKLKVLQLTYLMM